MTNHRDIVIIYHDQCLDGFGAAYAAWKRFGEDATYIPLTTQAPVPSGLTDKEIYIVDYSFDLAATTSLRSRNRSVVVIDHHQSSQNTVTAFPENVFNINHSGAVLAWRYFHPAIPIPKLLLYIEDQDLWRFSLPHHREIGASLALEPMNFTHFDELATNFEHEDFLSNFIAKGRVATTVSDTLVEELLTYRERVLFESNEVWAVNCARPHRSIVGHRLAQLNAAQGGIPLGIVYYRNQGAVHVSLRSEGAIDVAILAEKYGGGGHRNAASIRVASFSELPFSFLPLPSSAGTLE
jgi:oligoribonuclease NrnB/cAMP/cGMP phosphodiesterase (DHH superfamily)